MTGISIITAVYNAADTVAAALESVHGQTVACEHIVIDGASTDKTLEIIQSKGCRVQSSGFSTEPPLTLNFEPRAICVSEPDNGIYDALNKGLALATGDIIGILHANDLFASRTVLEQVARVFEDPNVDACYGDLEYVQFQGQGSRTQTAGLKVKGMVIEDSLLNPEQLTQNSFSVVRYWNSGLYNPRSFYWGWMPPHPTFFCRRSVYERLGGFNLSLGTAADYELMLRFLLKHGVRAVYIPEVLVYMRVGGASNESLKARLAANRMDRKAWELNELRPYPWTLFCKPLRKIGQYLSRR
jgi:glycosyltransferase